MSTEDQDIRTFSERLSDMPIGERQLLEIEIANKCNVAFGTIQFWRYGIRIPKKSSQEIIASIMDIPEDVLFPPIAKTA